MYVEVVVRLSRIYRVPSIHILPHVDYHYTEYYYYYILLFPAVDRIVSFFDLPHRCFSWVWLLHSWGTGGGSGSLHCIIMTRDGLVLLTHSLTGSAIQ